MHSSARGNAARIVRRSLFSAARFSGLTLARYSLIVWGFAVDLVLARLSVPGRDGKAFTAYRTVENSDRYFARPATGGVGSLNAAAMNTLSGTFHSQAMP